MDEVSRHALVLADPEAFFKQGAADSRHALPSRMRRKVLVDDDEDDSTISPQSCPEAGQRRRRKPVAMRHSQLR